MNPLQYTSEEMFSSTELIRKSKLVFDKLHKKEIEKAIILRDGKPSFMLLDFAEYEKIMTEYISLKEKLVYKNSKKTEEIKSETTLKNNTGTEEFYEEDKKIKTDNLNEKDLEDALAQIDNLDLEDTNNIPPNNGIKIASEDKESLKEFWE